MDIKIYTTNFSQSPFLNSQINEQIEVHCGKRTFKDEVVSISVWIKVENSIVNRGRDAFLCEVKMNTRSFGEVFSKESSDNCYEAAKVSLNEVFLILSKKMSKQRTLKKHLRMELKV